MVVLGKNYTTGSDGRKTTTLHVMTDFDSYYSNVEAGRGCVGKKVETIYAGDYDCSGIKPNMQIEVYYDKAISTSKGTFQPIKRIEVIPAQQKQQ